jgi:hypothetical protein
MCFGGQGDLILPFRIFPLPLFQSLENGYIRFIPIVSQIHPLQSQLPHLPATNNETKQTKINEKISHPLFPLQKILCFDRVSAL